MKMKCLLLFVMVIVCFAPPAYSEQDLFEKCLDEANGVGHKVLNCIHEELKRQGDRHENVYDSLMAALPEARQKKLEASDEAWSKYRESYGTLLDITQGGFIGELKHAMLNNRILDVVKMRCDLLQAELFGTTFLVDSSYDVQTCRIDPDTVSSDDLYEMDSQEYDCVKHRCLRMGSADSSTILRCLELDIEIANMLVQDNYQTTAATLSQEDKIKLAGCKKDWSDYTESYADFLRSAGDDKATKIRVAEWILISTMQQFRDFIYIEE